MVRCVAIHAGAGVAASLGISVALANTATPSVTPGIDGPFYDGDRAGVWLQERTPGRRTVLFMLGRSRVYERSDGEIRLVEPRPERATPGWTTDWSSRIPEMHAAGDYVDPSQTMDFGYGWPLVCLHSSQVLADAGAGGLTPRDEEISRVGGVVIPTGVAAHGLVLSSAVLGSPASVAVGAFWAVRFLRRRRRDLCPVCLYPIDAEIGVCPECGREHRERPGRLAA